MSKSNSVRSLDVGGSGYVAGDHSWRLPLIGSGLRVSDSSQLILPTGSYVEMPISSFGSNPAFNYPQSFVRLFDRTPISRLAVEAEKARDDRRAASLFRLAFARGERTPETIDAIERMTLRVFESGISVFLHEKIDGHDESEKSLLGNTASIRHFLERQVMSNVTFMDLVDLLDIFSPLFPIEAVSINYDGRDGIGPTEFTVNGVYEDAGDDELVFHVTIDAEEGRAQTVFASIDVGDYSKMGFGTRSLVSRSTFLRRHGSSGWSDIIYNDGLAVWPRMGGIVDAESMWVTAATLEMLDVLDAAKGFGEVDNKMGMEGFAGIELDEEDVIDHDALREWFVYHAGIDEHAAGRLKPPYQVGTMALESVGISAYFDVESVLDQMLWHYMPSRIHRMEGRRVSSEWDLVTLLADIGLFTAFQRTREEIETIDSAEKMISEASMVATSGRDSFGGVLVQRGPADAGDGSPIHLPSSQIIIPDIYTPEAFPTYGAIGMQNALQPAMTIAGLNMGPAIFIR